MVERHHGDSDPWRRADQHRDGIVHLGSNDRGEFFVRICEEDERTVPTAEVLS